MQLVGRRTYAVCVVIIALAACQKFLGLPIPQEVFIALFGLVAITMRAAVSNAAALFLALLIPLLVMTGCSTVNKDNINAGAKWAEKYYTQPNVAEIFHAEGSNVCVHITGATLLTISTPVPPKSIIPREPSFFEGLWDAVKTCAPYAFMYGIVAQGGIGNSSSTTVNNAAATP